MSSSDLNQLALDTLLRLGHAMRGGLIGCARIPDEAIFQATKD